MSELNYNEILKELLNKVKNEFSKDLLNEIISKNKKLNEEIFIDICQYIYSNENVLPDNIDNSIINKIKTISPLLTEKYELNSKYKNELKNIIQNVYSIVRIILKDTVKENPNDINNTINYFLKFYLEISKIIITNSISAIDSVKKFKTKEEKINIANKYKEFLLNYIENKIIKEIQ